MGKGLSALQKEILTVLPTARDEDSSYIGDWARPNQISAALGDAVKLCHDIEGTCLSLEARSHRRRDGSNIGATKGCCYARTKKA